MNEKDYFNGFVVGHREGKDYERKLTRKRLVGALRVYMALKGWSNGEKFKKAENTLINYAYPKEGRIKLVKQIIKRKKVGEQK